MSRHTTQRRDALRRQIDDAFADATYPGDEGLIPETSLCNPESQELRDLVMGRHWRELTLDYIDSRRINDTVAVLLSDEGFRYYLPAYMLAILEDRETADVMVDSVIYRLIGPFEMPSPERDAWLEWTGQLGDEQQRAVTAFLEFERDVHREDYPFDEPERALHSYWRDGLQKPQTPDDV